MRAVAAGFQRLEVHVEIGRGFRVEGYEIFDWLDFRIRNGT